MLSTAHLKESKSRRKARYREFMVFHGSRIYPENLSIFGNCVIEFHKLAFCHAMRCLSALCITMKFSLDTVGWLTGSRYLVAYLRT